MYRTQRISGEVYDPLRGLEAGEEFAPRGAQAMIPDVWLRWQWEPAFRQRLRLEFEGVAILGKIDHVMQGADPGDELVSRDIEQFAAAIEFDYVNMALATGFNAGFASGRSPQSDAAPGFGVIDQNVPNDDEDVLTAFKFDRNYTIDMIMFREIIGTVTNAMYFAPFVQYDLFAKQDDVIGLRLDVITAMAANSRTTPSGESWYGIETDMSLYYREPRYGADLSFGLYMPGGAFDGRNGRQRLTSPVGANVSISENTYNCDSDICANATMATSLQGRFFWAF